MYIPETIYYREFEGQQIRLIYADTADWWKWNDPAGLPVTVEVTYEAYRWIPEHAWVVFANNGEVLDMKIFPAWEYKRIS